MTASTLDTGAPRRILLATDLSARGDRALERAVELSQESGAELVILHVYEEFDESSLTYGSRALPSWSRPTNAVNVMKQRIRRALRADVGDAIEKATVLVEEGHPAEVIESVAAARQVDLVVTGIAREGPFSSRPVVLGKTVEQLLRKSSLPILVVLNRPRGPYDHVVVATDFSRPSAHALQMALRFFPGQKLFLLHAFDVPYENQVEDAARHAAQLREGTAEEMSRFFESVFLPPQDRHRLVPILEPGQPRQIVREYVQMHGADLVVLGTQGRGALMEALIGSTAKSILASLPCDALIVRGPPK